MGPEVLLARLRVWRGDRVPLEEWHNQIRNHPSAISVQQTVDKGMGYDGKKKKPAVRLHRITIHSY